MAAAGAAKEGEGVGCVEVCGCAVAGEVGAVDLARHCVGLLCVVGLVVFECCFLRVVESGEAVDRCGRGVEEAMSEAIE